MLHLLAQLIAPPLQRGPVRLPAQPPLQRPRQEEGPPASLELPPDVEQETVPPPRPAEQPAGPGTVGPVDQ